MKNALSFLKLLLLLVCANPALAFTEHYSVSARDVHGDYIVKKIWLTNPGLPDISLSDLSYTPNVTMPGSAHTGNPAQFKTVTGMDRKRPFVVLYVPAYINGAAAGSADQVSGFTVNVLEHEQAPKRSGARFSNVTNSVLATGTWYKIGITKTGFYKIDYNLLTSMGVKPSSVNPANIRVCGSGGNMLSKDNSVYRPTDLVENTVQFVGNSDNVFDNGEYVVFYGLGPTAWFKDSLGQAFHHQNNLYTDTAYYFISFNSGAGLRIATQTEPPTPNVNVTSYNYRAFHEQDLENPAGIGNMWYGEIFSPQEYNDLQTFSFSLGSVVATANCTVVFGSTSSTKGCSFSASLNSNSVGSLYFPYATGGSTDNDMNIGSVTGTVNCNSATATVAVNFTPADEGSLGYLYSIEVNAHPQLIISGDQMDFRDWNSVGPGHVAGFQLQGANSSTQVWDVTNPQAPVVMSGTLSGSTYSFSQDATSLHEYAAMNSANLYSARFSKQVPNQNLHNLGVADLIIVSHPDFLAQALVLDSFHTAHDNMRVVTVSTEQVYNEFSSGAQDLSAIRDFAKMFYDRASDSSQLPKYLLLFGGASYDYKNRVPGNTNFVPVFESDESSSDLNCFCTDDFYGFLDDSENIENVNVCNIMDIGVGRLPARTQVDATAVVNKIINYTQPASMGPWRISTTIVADKGCGDSAGDHMDDAEGMATTVAAVGDNLYDQGKVYVDAIPLTNTPAGYRCPNANASIDEQVFNGTFLINYNGHGNPTVWSAERILTNDDFNNWKNANMLPMMVTATCDFGQFDHPQYVSSAEQMLLEQGAGVISILTTTEAVYASYNYELNQQFLQAQFGRNADMSWNTFGEASRTGKNLTYIQYPVDTNKISNFRKFSLLGDPALTPDFPKYSIKIDSVMDGYTRMRADTVKALGAYQVDGSVHGFDGSLLSDFNGIVYVTFYDKPRNITTITGCAEVFQMQDNIVYKGRVSVQNGLFSFTYIAPKDINYSFGKGKISTYANTDLTDAAGNDTLTFVGGFSDHPVLSSTPPVVKAYINDSLFLDGGITGNNTSLFAIITDSTGINVSGNDVGHDLTGVLDDAYDAPYILNDYYVSAPNTYQRGYVSFPLNGLADGPHKLQVTAWDVNNNRGQGTVNFIVVDGQVVDIQQLGNYPNPFSGSTHFVFEHNHPFEQLNVQIEIYSISGSMVKNIQENLDATDSRTVDIMWDGTDKNGVKLPSGVYVYRLRITSDKGYSSTAYQKLVIVR